MARKLLDPQAGFSLVEVLVAVFLMFMILLAVAPMFLMAAEQNAAGGDLGLVGALAVERLEQLRTAQFTALVAGGSLVTDTTVSGRPYFDNSNDGYSIRWQIVAAATPVGGTRITVRALAQRQVAGTPKEVTLTAMRAR